MLTTRAYFINNMYLSGIHAGIQTAHSVAEMFCKFPNHPQLQQWAKVDKTIVVLNGGYAQNLNIICQLLSDTDLVWAPFHESVEALNGTITNVGVILDQSIYELNSLYRDIATNMADVNLSPEKLDEMVFDSASWRYNRKYSAADRAFFKAYQNLKLMG